MRGGRRRKYQLEELARDRGVAVRVRQRLCHGERAVQHVVHHGGDSFLGRQTVEKRERSADGREGSGEGACILMSFSFMRRASSRISSWSSSSRVNSVWFYAGRMPNERQTPAKPRLKRTSSICSSLEVRQSDGRNDIIFLDILYVLSLSSAGTGGDAAGSAAATDGAGSSAGDAGGGASAGKLKAASAFNRSIALAADERTRSATFLI